MRGKTVRAVFGGGRYAETESVTQYDYGQMLLFADIELPAVYEVLFAKGYGKAVKQIGGADGVRIPDAMLNSSGMISAWVFLHEGADDGETEYTVRIPVAGRSEDSGEEPAPEEQSVITEAIAALNAGVDTVQDIAEAIPQTVADALTEAKESGEFDGPPGDDGFSPTVEVTEIEGGHQVAITDVDGAKTFDVMDGEGGGSATSPTANVVKVGNTATITITDKNGTTTATVTDGANGQGGNDGATYTPSVSADGIISWTNDGGKANPPSVSIKGPKGDDYVLTAQDKADIAAKVTAPVQDVQVNGTSILSNGVANVPMASDSGLGVVKIQSSYGIMINPYTGDIAVASASSAQAKGGAEVYKPITPVRQHESVFYGLAKAAGDSTQSSSSNAVGTYTESAQSAINQMLNAPITVSGTTPSIAAKAGVQYVCGEVATLSFTPCATGCCDVVFTSGSTPTVLTVPSTVKWPDWFNPSALEANAVYEINILNGVYGAVGVWT